MRLAKVEPTAATRPTTSVVTHTFGATAVWCIAAAATTQLAGSGRNVQHSEM